MKFLRYFWMPLIWFMIGVTVLVSNLFFGEPINGIEYLCVWFVCVGETAMNGFRDFMEDQRYDED